MAKDDPTQQQPAGVSEDQTNTEEVTQTPGADIDQPVPTPDRATKNDPTPTPYTQVRSVSGDVVSTQPDSDKAVDAAPKRRQRVTDR